MPDTRILTFLLAVLVLIAVGAVLSLLQSVLLPFVIALFLAIILKPLVVALRVRRVPMALALLIVMLLIAAVLGGMTMIAVSSIGSFAEALPRYEMKSRELVAGLLASADGIAASFGMKVNDLRIEDAVQMGSVASILTSSLGSAISLLSNLFLILLYLIFMLAGSGQLLDKVRTAFPEGQSERVSSILAHISEKVRRYMVTKTLISLLTGAVGALTLAIIGVDFALLWGFVLFLFCFIPNIGSLIATLLPVSLALLQFDSPAPAIIALVLLIVEQNIIGNVLEPKWMAVSMNLSPLLILASLIFWGWLWGIWGMILAVPVMSMVKIVFEHIDAMRPVAALMGGGVQKDA